MPTEATPLVSIVTPSFNQGRFLTECLASVRRQNYPRIEHIVIDGGSTDNSVDILQGHPEITWISEPDAGQSDAINKGFSRARGSILAWLNADDRYELSAVQSAVDYLTRHGDVDLVYGDCDTIDEQGRRLGAIQGRPFDLGSVLLLDEEIPQPSCFLRRRILDAVGPLDVNLHLAMDFDYWVRIACAGHIEYSAQTWAAFRIHPDAKTSSRARQALGEHLMIFERAFADPRLPAAVRDLRRRVYSNAYLAGAVRSLAAGESEEARGRLTSALRLYPHPWRPKTLKAVFLLLDANLHVGWGDRTVRYLRRWKRPV